MVLGNVMTLMPAWCKRKAFFCVPPPPRQTTQSIPHFLRLSLMTPVMSFVRPSITMRCGLSRLVPRIVPPRVRMPERGIGFFQQILFLGADLAFGHTLE